MAAWLVAIALFVAPWASAADPPAETALAASVKAAYLCKFLNYIELPASAAPQDDAPFVIGVAGSDEVFAALQQMVKGRNVKNRPLIARYIGETDPLIGVHVLFVSRQIDIAQSTLVKDARDASVVVVSETPAGLVQGSIINFLLLSGRVRFEVNLDAAEAASIKISSRILAVAERVVGAR